MAFEVSSKIIQSKVPCNAIYMRGAIESLSGESFSERYWFLPQLLSERILKKVI
jgi:hypothetical protein